MVERLRVARKKTVTRTFNFLISPPLIDFQPNRPYAIPAFPTLAVHHEIRMNLKTSTPLNEAADLEAGYMADTLRARRDFTWSQRAAVVGLLTSATPDPRSAVPETPQPALRSFALILARCESAATLLGWRREITPDQKVRLDAAVHRLMEAAAQVTVCAAAPPERDKRVRIFRFPGR
jgi:hypothetical protein